MRTYGIVKNELKNIICCGNQFFSQQHFLYLYSFIQNKKLSHIKQQQQQQQHWCWNRKSRKKKEIDFILIVFSLGNWVSIRQHHASFRFWFGFIIFFKKKRKGLYSSQVFYILRVFIQFEAFCLILRLQPKLSLSKMINKLNDPFWHLNMGNLIKDCS